MKQRAESQADTATAPAARGPRATRKPEAIKWHITAKAEEAGDHDGFVASLPEGDDPELYVEECERVQPGQVCRIVKARGAGKKAGQLISSYRYTKSDASAAPDLPEADDDDGDPAEVYAPMRGREPGESYVTLTEAQRIAEESARRAVATVERTRTPTSAPPFSDPYETLKLRETIIAEEDRKRQMINEEVERRLQQLTPAPARVERAPRIESGDPLVAVAVEAAKHNPELVGRVFDILAPVADDEGWFTKGVRAMGEYPQLAQMAQQTLLSSLTIVKTIADRFAPPRPPAPEGGTPEQIAPAQAAPQFPPVIQSVLDAIGEDILNYLPQDDDETSGEVEHSCDVILDAAKANPDAAMMLTAIMALTPIEIINFLAGRSGLPYPGYEDLRVHGFGYIAKLKTSDQFFRDLKSALLAAQTPEQSAPTHAGASNNGTGTHEKVTV